MKTTKVANQVCVNNMVVNLNEKENIALEAIKTGVNDGWQTDEITSFVAEKLNSSVNTAKGYIGKLCEKGVIKKEKYKDFSIGWITQFSLND